MRITRFECRAGKQVLVAFAVVAISLGWVCPLPAQTTTWTGNAGNVWTRDNSWSADQPEIGSIAFFGSAAVGTIALRESNDPGSVSVGTILINSGSLLTGFAAGASAATINIGTTSAVSYLDAGAIPTEFEFGDRGSLFGASSPVVAVNLPGALQVRA